MESNSGIQAWFMKISDWLNDQAWFQDLKRQWDEVDPDKQNIIKLSILIGTSLAVLVFLVSSMWSVHKIKREYQEKSQLLTTVHSATEKLRNLKQTMGSGNFGGGGGASDAPWTDYFDQTASSAGIDKASMAVSNEKTADAPNSKNPEPVKESMYDISIKKVNVRQLVKLAYHMENGTRPVKIRNISIDTKQDAPGFLDATLSVSAFAFKQNEK